MPWPINLMFRALRIVRTVITTIKKREKVHDPMRDEILEWVTTQHLVYYQVRR
jgi:hypothetical protein